MQTVSEYAKNEAEKKAARENYARRSAELSQIIRPLRTANYECDYEWRYIPQALERYTRDYGGLELNPDYQRGHVWTQDQQQHYIENVLRGVISSSGFMVQFNCPNWENDNYAGDLPIGMQCIDGLQRISAVLKFLDGEVRPFGLQANDLAGSSFSLKSGNYRFRVAIHTFQTKAELLQHYLDLNAGGTPHSHEEIERIRQMHAAALATASKQ